MVQPVGSALHFVIVVAVLAGGSFLLAAFAHDMQLFAAQLHDFVEGFFKIHSGSARSVISVSCPYRPSAKSTVAAAGCDHRSGGPAASAPHRLARWLRDVASGPPTPSPLARW